MRRRQCQIRAKYGAARFLRGFGLVELMITLAITAVLLGLAIPSFNDAILGSKLNAYANGLVASSFLARGEAIKRNATVTMCVSADGATCATGGWEQGWIVLVGTTVLHKQLAASTGFKLTGSVTSVDYQPTGVGATQGTITVCRATPSVGAQERVVSISATGRASVSTTTTATCA